jgi:predicted ester cyclase
MTSSLAPRILMSLLTILSLGAPLTACVDGDDREDDVQNMEVVRRFGEEFKNLGNRDIIEETHSADCVFHTPDPRVTTRDAFKAFGAGVAAAFPDPAHGGTLVATIEDLYANGDRVTERTSVSATHLGEFQGIPATNKPVTWTEIHIYKFANGVIVEQWSEVNVLGILVQIGALPGSP